MWYLLDGGKSYSKCKGFVLIDELPSRASQGFSAITTWAALLKKPRGTNSMPLALGHLFYNISGTAAGCVVTWLFHHRFWKHYEMLQAPTGKDLLPTAASAIYCW
jgi:hypothetical protein